LITPKGTTRPICCLLDTVTTRSIVLSEMVFLSQVTQRKPTTWQTMSGSLVTNKIAQLVFKLPELSTSKQITWSCHVDETSKREKVPYDLILGLDFLSELKFVLNFESRTIQWEDHEVEMRPKGIVTDEQALDLIYQITQEPTVLKQAEERQARILDADYSKVELTDFVDSLVHLNPEEKRELVTTLDHFPTLFGGGLGALDIEPIHLELKDGAKPHHAKPFTIPQAFMNTTKKEIERFEKLGIWKRVHESAWQLAHSSSLRKLATCAF